MVEKLKNLIEKYSFGVCSYLAESAGLSSSRIRLYFIYLSFATFGSPILIYLILAFWLNLRKYIRKSYHYDDNFVNETIRKYATKLNLKKPDVHIINAAKPTAFALSAITSKIFVSVGLIDLLTKKELEAVLLHELGHIKNRSSSIKFWTLLAQSLSPLAAFSHSHLDQEEVKADQVAVTLQKSNLFIRNAKKRLAEYHAYASQT